MSEKPIKNPVEDRFKKSTDEIEKINLVIETLVNHTYTALAEKDKKTAVHLANAANYFNQYLSILTNTRNITLETIINRVNLE